MVSEGQSDMFVPTTEISTVIHLTHFFLDKDVSVILFGEIGCGKSVAFSKVNLRSQFWMILSRMQFRSKLIIIITISFVEYLI